MAARGDGVEGDECVCVVVVGRGEPGWRLSVEGEFGCELELGAAMVATVRLGCASREFCVGKKNKGKGREEWDALVPQGRPGSSCRRRAGAGRGASGAWPDAAVAERGVRGRSSEGGRARSSGMVMARRSEAAARRQQAQRARAVQRGRRQRSCPALLSSAGSERREREEREKERSKRVDFKFSQNF